jgi:DNA-binding response OmpR family regulator
MNTARKARILIAEGDRDAGAFLVRTLEAFGHRAVWTRDTGAAIEGLRGEWADLVLVDAGLLATIGAAESLARYVRFFDIPVILMRAAPDASEDLSHPLYPCLYKPVSTAEMHDLVERELRGRFAPGPTLQDEPVTTTIAPPSRFKTPMSGSEPSLSS